jgi:ATP-dependent helicase/DNAse subunit B
MSVKINGYDLPSHISYSQLTTWLDCGWKYYLSRIVQLKEDGSWWLVGGSSVHEATEAFDQAMYRDCGQMSKPSISQKYPRPSVERYVGQG